MAVAGAIFAPTVAAVTRSYDSTSLPARLGRNAAFDRAGNIFIAVLAGIVAGALTACRLLSRTAFCTPHQLRRTVDPRPPSTSGRARGLRRQRRQGCPSEACRTARHFRKSVFLVLTAANALLHFANAPMLLSARTGISASRPGETAFVSASLITAQLVKIPVALLVGRRAIFADASAFCWSGFRRCRSRLVLYEFRYRCLARERADP